MLFKNIPCFPFYAILLLIAPNVIQSFMAGPSCFILLLVICYCNPFSFVSFQLLLLPRAPFFLVFYFKILAKVQETCFFSKALVNYFYVV